MNATRRAITLVKLLVLMLVLGISASLVIVGTIRGRRSALLAECCGNLKQLHWVLINLDHDGCRHRSMAPTDTGGALWINSQEACESLGREVAEDLLFCPLSGNQPVKGQTDYRGPCHPFRKLPSGAIVGADKEGNHGPGRPINVLFLDGSVREVAPTDSLWPRVMAETKP